MSSGTLHVGGGRLAADEQVRFATVHSMVERIADTKAAIKPKDEVKRRHTWQLHWVLQ
jgi:hypothetical protein